LPGFGSTAPQPTQTPLTLTRGGQDVHLTIHNDGRNNYSVRYTIGGQTYNVALRGRDLEAAKTDAINRFNDGKLPGFGSTAPQPTQTPLLSQQSTDADFTRRVLPLLTPQEQQQWREYEKNNPSIVTIVREAAHDATDADRAEAARALIKGAYGQDVVAWLRDGGLGSGRLPPGGNNRPSVSTGSPDDENPSTITADQLNRTQAGEIEDAEYVLSQYQRFLEAANVSPQVQREVLRNITSTPTNFSTARPWALSNESLGEIVAQSAQGKTLVLYTRREAADLQQLMQSPQAQNLTFVEVSDKDTNKLAALNGLLSRPDIGSFDRVIAVGGAGVKDLTVTLLAIGRGNAEQVRGRFFGQDQTAIDAALHLAGNQLKPSIDYVSVPTILSTTAPGTPFAVLKEGNTVVIDQRPAFTVVPLAKMQQLPPEKLQALTASGLTDYMAGISYAAGMARREGISLDQAIQKYVPEAWNVFKWFEANRGDFRTEQLAVAAYALRDYTLNNRPPVGGEHDFWDAFVSLHLTGEMRASHGQVVAMGSLIQTHLYGQMTGDYSVYNRMRSLYTDIGVPITPERLQSASMTKELMVRAIEYQVSQPTNRPSLIQQHFAQFTDPVQRRQAIEQMLDRVFFAPNTGR
jgi:glycerol dehydrogenase-like iron-containing ADH family enzyme